MERLVIENYMGDNNQKRAHREFIIGILIVAVVFGLIVYKIKGESNTSILGVTTTQTMQNVAYKDGTYEVKGNYTSPGGPEEIDVKLTLTHNLITDATVVSEATRSMSQKFQGEFVDNYKPLVIGKNINEVILTKVSGSSLTPKGFNDAVEKIKQQAKVG